jgi:clan AA aspartic protease (TIGR02281 family)
MSRITTPNGLALALVSFATTSLAGGPEDDLLRSKGLRLSGSIYVLPAEDEVKSASEVAAAQLRAYRLADLELKDFERGAAGRKAAIEALTQRRSALNQQYLQTMPGLRAQVQALTRQQAALRRQLPGLRQAALYTRNGYAAMQHNQVVEMIEALGDRIDLLQDQGNQLTATLNELTDRLKLLSEGGDESGFAREARARAGRRREAYLQALLELRTLVDATDDRYAALASDAEVTGALEALNRRSKRIEYQLGPRRKYRDCVKALERAEARVTTETLELHEDRGVLWIDVALNGKVAEPMVFDTGASLVSLPSDLAARVGLRPTAADPTIELHTADGSVVDGKLMKLATVRVGKFTVADVPCVVLPPDKKGVDPLLGGSFLRHFLYEISPESGRLSLTRVDASTAGRGNDRKLRRD